jgi:hypothetical protein
LAGTTVNQPKWDTLSSEAFGKQLQINPAKRLSTSVVQPLLQMSLAAIVDGIGQGFKSSEMEKRRND